MKNEFNLFKTISLFIFLMGFWFGIPLIIYISFIYINYINFYVWQAIILFFWLLICIYNIINAIKDPYNHRKMYRIIK